MPLCIAVRKDTKEIFDSVVITPIDPVRRRAALAQNHGIAEDNILILSSFTDEQTARIRNGDDYELQFSGDELTGVSFASEDAKRYLKAFCNKTEALADGLEQITVRVEVWKADGSGIDTAVNGTAQLPILTPNGEIKVRVTATNGVAQRTFSTVKAGRWVVPSRSRVLNFRVGQQVTFETILPFENLS